MGIKIKNMINIQAFEPLPKYPLGAYNFGNSKADLAPKQNTITFPTNSGHVTTVTNSEGFTMTKI